MKKRGIERKRFLLKREKYRESVRNDESKRREWVSSNGKI